MSYQQHAPAALYPGKDPVPVLQEAGWTPGLVWTGGKSRSHRDSIPDRPAHSQSLYLLSYPAHNWKIYLIHNGNRKLGKMMNVETDEGVSVKLQSQKKEKKEKENEEEKKIQL